MENKDGWIWYDENFVPWREARVHVLTHTLHYGMGVFEGVRAYLTEQGTAIFRLQDHTKRLFDSARMLGITMPYTPEQMNAAQKEVLIKNKLDSAYIRPMIFYGAEGMGLHTKELKVHGIVAAWQWGAYLGEENMQRGISVKVSSIARYAVNTAMCRAKANGYYINSMLALQEAQQHGYDEALMLDVNGYLAEGSGENIFILSDGVIYTPELGCVLDGITRRTIIELATNELGMDVVEKKITRDEAYIADEVFFTGTAAEVAPVRKIDEHCIADGKRGPVTEKLQALYNDVVGGRNKKYQDYLTFI
ncbi:MAG: branched-chain amino acid transaminase [Chromatiales bacterium]|nr:branched-chain amino acid transaminase [Chromatiales bacterium]